MTLRMCLSALMLLSVSVIQPLCAESRATVSGFADRIKRIVEFRNWFRQLMAGRSTVAEGTMGHLYKAGIGHLGKVRIGHLPDARVRGCW
jgi:hypothetical protein